MACQSVVVTVTSIDGNQIVLDGWPALTLSEDTQIEGELMPGSIVQTMICYDEDNNVVLVYIAVLENPVLPLPPIESLLDIHRMEEAKLTPEIWPTDMGELIDEVREQFLQGAESKQLSISIQKPAQLPMAMLDRKLMKRVIGNLLNNAIRHTPAGGMIEGSVSVQHEEDLLIIRIRDSGEGLPVEYHQKIFEKFEQVKLKKAGKMVGRSGLGLAFCKMAVEAHSGKIWVESEGEGKGCLFILSIPFKGKEKGALPGTSVIAK